MRLPSHNECYFIYLYSMDLYVDMHKGNTQINQFMLYIVPNIVHF